MLRTTWTAVVALVMTLIVAPTVTIIALVNSRSGAIDALIQLWARSICGAAGLRITAEGFEKLPAKEKFIFVANHTSYLDIPVLLSVVPFGVRFMAKKSLFVIPIFGWGLRATGFIPIDRKDRSKAVRSFDLAGDRIRKGNSIVIFPEEGRSHHRTMKPFQRGAFLLAIRAKLPIVPVAIIGTFDSMPVGRLSIRGGAVTIRAAEALDPEQFTVREKDQLIERTRSTIERMLESDPNRTV